MNFIGYLNKPIKNKNFKKLKALIHYEFKPSYIKKLICSKIVMEVLVY